MEETFGIVQPIEEKACRGILFIYIITRREGVEGIDPDSSLRWGVVGPAATNTN